MEHHELIAWIRSEITSTRVVLCQEVVGYNEFLEPNPEMCFCEFTSHPVTSDGQYIIVKKPVYGTVARTVLDETCASAAAEALAALILADERYIYLAEELMGNNHVFTKYWEYLRLHCKDVKTIKIALRHLGRAPSRLFVRKIGRIAARLRPPFEFAGKFSAAICFYGTIIYLVWPNSKLALWIGRIVKRVLLESKRIIYG